MTQGLGLASTTYLVISFAQASVILFVRAFVIASVSVRARVSELWLDSVFGVAVSVTDAL